MIQKHRKLDRVQRNYITILVGMLEDYPILSNELDLTAVEITLYIDTLSSILKRGEYHIDYREYLNTDVRRVYTVLRKQSIQLAQEVTDSTNSHVWTGDKSIMYQHALPKLDLANLHVPFIPVIITG